MSFNKDGEFLALVRTWCKTITGGVLEELTKIFNYNTPQGCSIAHIYLDILNGKHKLVIRLDIKKK
jgi:hypothetical protein